MRKWVLLAAMAAAFLAGLLWFLYAPAEKPSTLHTLQPDNRYPQLLSAAEKTRAARDSEELAAETQNALTAIQEAFEGNCRVPVRLDRTFLVDHQQDIEPLRALTRILTQEAQEFASEGNYDKASRFYLALLRLSHCASHGGLLIDGIIGRAAAASGLEGLASIFDSLSQKQQAEALETLRTVKKAWDPAEDFIEREGYLADRTASLPARVFMLFSQGSYDKIYEHFKASHRQFRERLEKTLNQLSDQ